MTKNKAIELTNKQIIDDYRHVYVSRQASLLGRKEVLAGKAKFGIFGDGKELAQVALAKSFQPGDWRSGYYRDQTMMFALGISSVREFFSQLYADSQVENEPASAGRQMNSHFRRGVAAQSLTVALTCNSLSNGSCTRFSLRL